MLGFANTNTEVMDVFMNFKSHLSLAACASPLRTLGLSAAITAGLTLCAVAQDADTAETSTPAETPAPTGLSTGTPVEDNIGRTYTLETHGDWEIRCINAPEGTEDPCNMYQLLQDAEGNDVSEFTLFHYGQGEVEAGATIVTPLETLLTEQLTITVDGANGRRYPYSFCNPIGCYARVGMTANDIASFKKGAKAVVTLTPFATPNKSVPLDVSLSGFTAAYARVTELNIAARAANSAAQ